MDKIIEKLISIEENAHKVVKTVRDMETNFDDDVSESIDELKANIQAKADGKIAYINKFEKDNAENKIEQVKSQLGQSYKNLEERYSANKEVWVDGIVNKIIDS